MTISCRIVTIALLFVVVFATEAKAQRMDPKTYVGEVNGKREFVIDFSGNDPVIESLQKIGRLFEDNILNKVIIKMAYYSKTNRLYSQSFVCSELADPCDISMTRTPDVDPNTGEFVTDGLPSWRLIGQLCGRNWGPYSRGEGARYCAAGLEFISMTMKDGTVGLCISTASGTPEPTRYSGGTNGQDLECRILVMPNGDIVFGYNSNPEKRSKFIFAGGDIYCDCRILPLSGDPWSMVAPTVDDKREGLVQMRSLFTERKD